MYLILDNNYKVSLKSFRDKTGRLPLHYAVETGDLQCIRLLVEKGSEINCRYEFRYYITYLIYNVSMCVERNSILFRQNETY
jgi:ankyrin repeat protein